jgi:hypothetical protein
MVNSTSARMKTMRHVPSDNRCPMKSAVDARPARSEIPKSQSAAFLKKVHGISTSHSPGSIVLSTRRTRDCPVVRPIVDDVTAHSPRQHLVRGRDLSGMREMRR